ncbi:DUF732 domain-containing protein [Mycolicibacter heraklionensis]|uniref:DUF732 domain-containing protein n=1 Tax=Mycolicibacter heraklionensis TaxID=512402 RepID=UPI001E4EFAE5|nr:DUF732 domain-containing protein [Mycolicibacter heraklionensis]
MDWCSAMKMWVASAFSVAMVGAGVLAPIPVAVAQPDQDQVFFDELEQQGVHPDYDKQICGSIKCESLRTLLVQEGHAVCVALADSPRLVPASVIANLEVPPDQAHAIINASRHAYCPQLPDPYSLAP